MPTSKGEFGAAAVEEGEFFDCSQADRVLLVAPKQSQPMLEDPQR